MDKLEFLAELKKALSFLNSQERDEALLYYSEYLEEAGSENEAKAIKELGSPRKIAAEIKAETAFKDLENSGATPKKSLRVLWLGLKILAAAPLALPLLLLIVILFLLILSLNVVVWCAVISALLLGLIFLFIAVVGIIFPLVSQIMVAGVGIALLGMGLLLSLFAGWLLKKSVFIMMSISRGIMVRSKRSLRKDGKVEQDY